MFGNWIISRWAGDISQKKAFLSLFLSLIRPCHHLSNLYVVSGATLSGTFPPETQRFWTKSLKLFPPYFTGLLLWGSWTSLTVLSVDYLTCMIGRYGPRNSHLTLRTHSCNKGGPFAEGGSKAHLPYNASITEGNYCMSSFPFGWLSSFRAR